MKKIILFLILAFLVCSNSISAKESITEGNTISMDTNLLIAESSMAEKNKWYNNKLENDKPVLYHTMHYNGYSTPAYHNSYKIGTPVKSPAYSRSTDTYKPNYTPTYSKHY